MSVALIFPPVVDPRAPHLALPSLAASLRAHGEEVHLFDCNVHGMRYLLRRESLQGAADKLRARMRGRWDLTSPESVLALYAKHVVAGMSEALAVLSDPLRFFDANAFNSARDLVVAGLAVHAAAYHPAIRYDIMPARYDVDGVDPQSLRDLINVARAPEYNLFAQHWDEWLFPALARTAPELVGVTITNRQQLIPGLTLARRLRAAGYFTIIGGTVFTKFATELRTRPDFFEHFADAVIPYEGETAVLTLLQELRGTRRFTEVPNLIYADNGRVRFTRTHVEDINALPTPDFAGLDLKAYLAPYPVLPILTGKGCYFNRCKFCDIPFINHISRKAYRVRDAEIIAADINSLADRFDCRHFLITDEALSPKLLVKLADALLPVRSRGYTFTGYARLEDGFTREVCNTLHDMGLRKLYFGLESADQKTLDHMDKGTSVAVAPVVLENCAAAGINFHLFSIIGFPHESLEAARSTCDFLLARRDVLDRPGNSFDVHPFGLELRTDYFRDREALDIAIAPQALAKDFVIGIEGSQWQNADSLGHTEVARLMRDEFYPKLRAMYRRFQATRDGIWPGFEEYAGLYAAHYQDRNFPYFTALDGLDLRVPVIIDWSAALAVITHADEVLVLNRHGFLRLPRVLFEALRGLRVQHDLVAIATLPLGGITGTAARVSYIDSLIARRFLEIRLDDASASGAENVAA